MKIKRQNNLNKEKEMNTKVKKKKKGWRKRLKY